MFNGTPEQEAVLCAELNKLKCEKGASMRALQKAQEIYGYLPIEVLKMISENLDVTMHELYGIATFYSQFNLKPHGKYKIGVCIGTACYVKGGGDIFDRFRMLLNVEDKQTTEDGMFTLEGTRCIGCCGLAPVLTVNDDVYGKATLDDVDKILAKYK